MKKSYKQSIRIGLLAMGFLAIAASVHARSGETFPLTFNFEQSPGDQWSPIFTLNLGGNKVLGPYNDLNQRYGGPRSRLTLRDIPANTSLRLDFDLYLIGTWDSTGKLADRWTLSTKEGKTVIELKQFPNAYQDKDEKIPIGAAGYVEIKNRKLAYWVVKQSVTVPAEQIKRGELTLIFEGALSGRSTEFWALDNVSISLAP